MEVVPGKKIWDFWAPRYRRLWAQRYSLGPSRALVLERLAEEGGQAMTLLDAGCGVGQLLAAIADHKELRRAASHPARSPNENSGTKVHAEPCITANSAADSDSAGHRSNRPRTACSRHLQRELY